MTKTTYVTYRELMMHLMRFLKKHDALKDFKQNVTKSLYDRYGQTLPLSLYVNPLASKDFNGTIGHNAYFEYCSYDLIDLAFTWRDTPQGHDYWSALNQLWNDNVQDKCFKLIVEKNQWKEK